MKSLFILLAIFASSLNAQVVFRGADSCEKEEILCSMIAVYTEQLIQAGLFNDISEAKKAAKAEIVQEELCSDKRVFSLLTLDECNELYGYLVYSLEDQAAYLEAIYIEERFQGKGLGRQFLAHFVTLFFESEIKSIKLFVFDHNQIAMGLYLKMGFVIEQTYYKYGNPFGHHMKKDLYR